MRVPALLCGLFLGSVSLAWAQAPTTNYFGNSTSVPDTSVKPGDTPSVSQPAGGAKLKPSPETKAASAEPEMKGVLALLTVAKEKLLSTTSTTPKADSLPMAEAAFAALKKTNGDGRYRGHRAKAMGKLKDAIAELQSGDRTNKAAGYVSESIAEVNMCAGLEK